MIYSITKNNHIVTIVDKETNQGQLIYKSILVDCNYPIEINRNNQMTFISAHNKSKDIYNFKQTNDITKFLKYYSKQQYGCKKKSIFCFVSFLLIILGLSGYLLFNNENVIQSQSKEQQISQEKIDYLTTDFFLQEANKIKQYRQSSLLPNNQNIEQKTTNIQNEKNDATNKHLSGEETVSDEEFLINLKNITQ